MWIAWPFCHESRPPSRLPAREALNFPELIAPIEGDIVITKTDPNAFLNTTLEATLKSKRISRLLICGIWTTCCVKGTLDAARGRVLEVIVVADAHGDSLTRTSEIKQWNETWDAFENVSAIRLADIDFSVFCP
jgi:nicotinamidase-related amidase